jgi:hypothetical protein
MSAMLVATLAACVAQAPDPPLPPPLPATAPPAVAPAPASGSRELASVRVVATGDLMLHHSVQRAAEPRGFAALLAATHPLVEGADVAFTNLESPVAPKTGVPIAQAKQYDFNAPPEFLASLVETGFDVVSFANNHVYDQGREGFAETLQHLDEAKLAYVGAGRTCAEALSPRFFEAQGLKIAMLGTSQLYNDRLNAGPDEPCADTFDLERVLAAARAARAEGAEAVILSIHWGVEYATAPTEAQVATAQALLEGGVDVVLGHHPHVLAPLQVLHTADGRLGVVAYSLGNYISNQSAWYEPGLNPPSAANPRDGVMLSFRVVRREYGLPSGKTVTRTELADLAATPLWTRNNGATRGKDGQPEITVEPLPDRIVALRAELASATRDADIVRLGTELDEMERRWKQVSRVLGEQYLVEHP